MSTILLDLEAHLVAPPIQIPLLLEALIWRPENLENWLTMEKTLVTCCELRRNRVTSSAYCWILTTWHVPFTSGSKISEISQLCLIFIANSSTPRINSIGEKGQPCLTPHSVGNHSDNHPACCTELSVLANSTLTHWIKVTPKLNSFKTVIRKSLLMESKALQ